MIPRQCIGLKLRNRPEITLQKLFLIPVNCEAICRNCQKLFFDSSLSSQVLWQEEGFAGKIRFVSADLSQTGSGMYAGQYKDGAVRHFARIGRGRSGMA